MNQQNELQLKNKLYYRYPLSKYSAWQTGGNAEYFYQPQDLDDLIYLLQNWQKTPITLLGAATNVLIRDQGIEGLVISLRNTLLDFTSLTNNCIRVGASVILSQLAKKCIELGMADSAFMAGIPGTLGGALKMNAGAFGDAIWNHVKSVTTIELGGKITNFLAPTFTPSYRQLIGLAPNQWFIAAELNFKIKDQKLARQLLKQYLQKRTDTQPLNFPNCGSVFRNPANGYAAKIIEQCGLKGKRIGDAQISPKHANFIINRGRASSTEIENLIEQVRDEVKKVSGITLIPEIQYLGKK